MARLFGTDGVRGLANDSLTAELALDLSVSAAHVLADRGDLGPPIGEGGHRPFAVVGRDPRISGQFLEAAVVAGLASAGVDVVLLGVLPTPGVAYLTDTLGADLGVMISASHNAMPDNGIKFLARGGRKLDDASRSRSSEQLHETWTRPTGGSAVGTVRPHPTAVDEYAAHLVRSIDHPLAGLQGRGRLRRGRGLGGRTRGRSPTPAPTWWRSTPPPTAPTSTTAAARPTSSRCAAPSWRTAPTSASRSTATPTAAWPSTPMVRSSTATRSWRSSRWP